MPQTSALNFQSSSLTGLATMRKMAKESISYQDAIDTLVGRIPKQVMAQIFERVS